MEDVFAWTVLVIIKKSSDWWYEDKGLLLLHLAQEGLHLFLQRLVGVNEVMSPIWIRMREIKQSDEFCFISAWFCVLYFRPFVSYFVSYFVFRFPQQQQKNSHISDDIVGWTYEGADCAKSFQETMRTVLQEPWNCVELQWWASGTNYFV